MTNKQKALARKHGTPEQFKKAVLNAYNNLTITWGEAQNAIVKYNKEYREAGNERG